MRARHACSALLAVVLLVLFAPPAGAHVDLDPEEAVAGSVATLTFSFHHGKDGSATTALSVRLPDGAELVDIPPVEGFTAAVDGPVVTWSGGRVPDGVQAEFPLVVRLPPEPGLALFPVIQDTEAGELAWIAEDEGDDGDEATNPAPRLTLVADPSATTEVTTSTTSTPPTTRARPATTVEAAERDDGDTNQAPWLIGSGLAALVAIALGGTWLRSRMR